MEDQGQEEEEQTDPNYPFDTKDTRSRIIYTIDRDGKKSIRAASLHKLIEKLTEESGLGLLFFKVFMSYSNSLFCRNYLCYFFFINLQIFLNPNGNYEIIN